MTRRLSLVLALYLLSACGDDAGLVEDASARDASSHDAHTEPPPSDDAGHDGDAGSCPTGGSGMLELTIELETDVLARVNVLRGSTSAAAVTASGTQTLSAGVYTLEPHRVRKSEDIVGPAYQGAVVGGGEVCVLAGKTVKKTIEYTREPGSARLWLTQSNGSGTQVMAFDAAQLADRGDQTPSVSLKPNLDNAGPIRVDGKGRLWVASNTGKLAGYNTARLGASSDAAPDILLQGPALCEEVVPCGPTAMAFDAQGNLWVSTLTRIVKLGSASLNASGSPAAAVTITSTDAGGPRALAFDAQGNLWVGDADGAVVKFAASRLTSNLANASADLVIFAQQPGPVMLGLGGPEGLVVDGEGNLWVGYFTGNQLVRFTKNELMSSALAANPIIPSVFFAIGVEALVTDLGLDENGNLWLPGSAGNLYRIAKEQFSLESPQLTKLHSAEIGSVEKISFNTVPGGPLFIAP